MPDVFSCVMSQRAERFKRDKLRPFNLYREKDPKMGDSPSEKHR